jgi:hypothetical protein
MNVNAEFSSHIPDEWSRDSTKIIVKHAVSLPVSDTPGNVNDSPGPAIKPPAPPKKRKRATAAIVKTSNVVETTEHIDMLVDVSGLSTDALFSSKTDDESMIISTDFPTPPIQSSTFGAATLSTKEAVSATSRRNCDETESVMRALYHQVEKLARRPGCALEEGIYLDSIMTHIPYVEVLQQMFGGSALTDTACVPVVTRAYEESYMREVLSGVDEPCIMGSNCECQFIDEHNPFTGVQFTLPVEAFSAAATAAGMVEELSSNKLCVLCCRKHTQSLFYEALYNHRAYSACIQLYGNICDCPGEYAKEAMLICPLSGPINNMPLPVVAHQRNRYSVVVHNGVRQLRQHRVAYEDFHVPSLSRC